METGIEACWAEDLRIASASQAPVLITAESPAAREAFARRIHRGGRREQTFTILRCAPQPCDARTVADALARSRDGTLFLDNVSALTRDAQRQMLAALESPNGVRILTGNDSGLMIAVQAGRFSDVLFYRLNIIHVYADEQKPS